MPVPALPVELRRIIGAPWVHYVTETLHRIETLYGTDVKYWVRELDRINHFLYSLRVEE